ncbi:hypothetical protein KQX54_004453 [Cotesia glomerata]|uniref:Uncharacterized protein n=1 Tax=Cotesia glomerata TaxID=32391 RepID=A0AAV7I085_COTGL|nr:hypothetical protein KQX54_004453 [Cotesia glomerata]
MGKPCPVGHAPRVEKLKERSSCLEESRSRVTGFVRAHCGRVNADRYVYRTTVDDKGASLRVHINLIRLKDAGERNVPCK